MDAVYTLEADPDEPDAYVTGIRHVECVTRQDRYLCIVREPQPDATTVAKEMHGYECWGCTGWLHEPPLTVDETARVMAAPEE